MRVAKEKWMTCAGFADYEICLGPTITIRRSRCTQGSFKGKVVAIQFYKKQFWATLYNADGQARRVNVNKLAEWSSARAWKLGATEETGRKAKEWVRAPKPVPLPTPKPEPWHELDQKPTIAQVRGWVHHTYGQDLAVGVKRRELERLEAWLEELEAEAASSATQQEAKGLTPPERDGLKEAVNKGSGQGLDETGVGVLETGP